MSKHTTAQSAYGVTSLADFVFSASYSTAAVPVEYHRAFSLALYVTGSGTPVAGTMALSGSHDGVNFYGIGSTTAVAGNGTYFQNYDSIATAYVKGVFTRASGAATTYASSSICVI